MKMTKKLKSCIVPTCCNTSRNSDKIFIHLPSNKTVADKWFLAVGRPIQKNIIGYYCCEDHFTLEEDCRNWMAFKLIQNKVVMKNDVVPHLNLTENRINQQYSQLSEAAKRRKTEILESYETSSEIKLEEEESPVPIFEFVACNPDI